jgi:diphthine synthase
MLYLISLGLNDEKDLSVRALEAAKKCDRLYCEFYTSRPNTSIEKLSELAGMGVTELGRGDLEENSRRFLEEAKGKIVGLLVGGDALSATTHISLLLDAGKMGIEYEVIHGSSIFTAVAETGLQLYNFGKATTLPFPEEGYKPASAYDMIEQNKKAGLHTLVLLDTKPGMQMDCITGISILKGIEAEKGKGVIAEEKIIACVNLGGLSVIKYNTPEMLISDPELKGTPAVLIIPGKLHFLEKEYLDSF